VSTGAVRVMTLSLLTHRRRSRICKCGVSCGDHVTAVSRRRASVLSSGPPRTDQRARLCPTPPDPGPGSPHDAELAPKMVQYMHSHIASRYERTPQQELARAELLRRSFPKSQIRPTELAAAEELAAHERRAGVIAQLKKLAAAADDTPPWQAALRARLAEDARRRKVTAWLFAGFIAALVCGFALLGVW
jgi:hypothetical protein